MQGKRVACGTVYTIIDDAGFSVFYRTNQGTVASPPILFPFRTSAQNDCVDSFSCSRVDVICILQLLGFLKCFSDGNVLCCCSR